LEREYGPSYASPCPELFEAMNLNITTALSKKLSAKPLDDVFRMPLYEYKAVNSVKEVKTALDIIDKARQVLFLPSQPVIDVDAFLELHRDKRVRSFREKVQSLCTDEKQLQKLSREIHDANMKFQELEIDRFNVVMGFVVIIGSYISTELFGNFVTFVMGTMNGLERIGREILKPRKAERYDWLDLIMELHSS
jgi:hypothetical protein